LRSLEAASDEAD